jgi:hypothetical protein
MRPGRLTYAGVIGTADEHAHHAVQLMVAGREPFVVRDSAGRERSCYGVVVPANVAHGIPRGTPDGLLVLVDPFSTVGRALAGGHHDVRSWRHVPAP